MRRFLCFLSFLCVAQATVVVTVDLAVVSFPQTDNYTATIDPAPAAGSVATFFDNGVALSPTIPVTINNGRGTAVYIAQLTTGPQPGNVTPVSHLITAKVKKQASAAVTVKVYQGRTRGVLTTDNNLYQIGDTVTVTAALRRAKGTGIFSPPIANVNFYRNGAQILVGGSSCTKLVAANPPDPNGATFTCTFTIGPAALVGPQEIKVVYTGNPKNAFGGVVLKKTVTFECAPPKADCDGDNTCETDTSTSTTHCGTCSNDCTSNFPHANTICQASTCVQQSCIAPFGDCACGTDATNKGCETNLNTNKNHCGSCNTDCASVFINADGHCNAGTCVFDTCDTNFGNCATEAGPFDGCETNFLTNDHHCGSCSLDCTDNQNSIGHCNTGTCAIDSCKTGFFDCNTNPTDGCETACASAAVIFDHDVFEYNENSDCPSKLADFALHQIPRAGTGNSNGHFVVATQLGVEISLRLEKRTQPDDLNVGGNVYRTTPCFFDSSKTKSIWNYAFNFDLRRATGAAASTTLGDYDLSLDLEILDNSNTVVTGFPLHLDAKGFAANLIFDDICTTCSVTSPYTFHDGSSVSFSNCQDLAAKTVDTLTFFQESTNIMFPGQLPTFQADNSGGLYQITFSAVPKEASVASHCGLCPLSVSMVVMIDPAGPACAAGA